MERERLGDMLRDEEQALLRNAQAWRRLQTDDSVQRMIRAVHLAARFAGRAASEVEKTDKGEKHDERA